MKRATQFGELEIFDAHTHFFSRRFFETLTGQSPQLSKDPDPIARAAEMTGWTMPPSDAVEFAGVWKDEFDRHGIAGAMMMASVPGDEESIAAAVAAFPDRIAGAFMFDPTRPDVEARTKRALDEMKLRVVCLFPAMHNYSIAESEGARTVVELASQRPGTAVFVHCGALSVGVRRKLGLPSRFDLRRSDPLEIYKLADEYPSAKFIVPHFGAGMFREAMMLADLRPNVYIDTSSSNKWMNYEPSPVDLSAIFKRAMNVVGAERLLFGTDSSFFPRGWVGQVFEAQLAALTEIGAGKDQVQAIFGGNLRKLLQIDNG